MTHHCLTASVPQHTSDDNEKPFSVSWFGGVTRIDTAPRSVGNKLVFGCAFDGGEFEPYVTLTFENGRPHAEADINPQDTAITQDA